MSSFGVVVAGFGSIYRGDDAVGPLVAELFVREHDGVRDVGPLAEPLDLLGRFDGADLAIVIDAVRSGAPVGSVRTLYVDLEDTKEDDLAAHAVTSTHGIGLVGVLRLAHAIGCAPRQLVLVAVEGADFALGASMSAEVLAAVPEALRAVATTIERSELCA